MGIINVPHQEADAIKSIDSAVLSELISRCIDEERATALSVLNLWRCGQYVSEKFRVFERDLAVYAKAKSAQKREDTRCTVLRSGEDLEYSVCRMKARVATEEQEAKLFRVDDQILSPVVVGDQLRVIVRYSWRDSLDQDWQYGSVTFLHDVVFKPDYLAPVPKRKPSAAQKKRESDRKLYDLWGYLRDLGLQEVRDHFRRGGSGSTIPTEVHAKPDPHSHCLNNFSVRF